ncbi:DUF4388 domain-containing protein [Anaeromyxobacter dehalogenans]|uniref:PatA-like N-terminal domain-containing protein n=1 Tax=Anaeromyxobacter dehalogenans (strain 2CP-C) TaxID=290397 RepID=Q2IGJ9_ANADE|nr:DUF4388 domain-containing protein [Anaeromyxobacter dehalogenans]ABC83710.1 hypothetical protein Adeh_3946 [Anaeromyxobacter dehalogenans 2CP-C]
MRAKLSVGAEGQVTLPPREAEALGLAGGGDAELVSARGAFALIAPARGETPRSWFAGSLSALSVPEVIQFVFTSLKTGVLLLAFGADGEHAAAPDRPEQLRRRSIFFRDGQVVFASSSEPAERLGPMLVRSGLVRDEDLERCRHLVSAGHPLGQVLVDQGLLSPGQLYEGMTLQVTEILMGSFLEPAGTFAFLEGRTDEQNAVKLPQRTRELLLEGMRRVEEAEQLGRELGGREVVLRRGAGGAGGLLPVEARLVEAVDGARTLPETARAASLTVREALAAAVALVRRGVLSVPALPAAPAPAEPVVEAPRPTPPPGVRTSGPFEIYRRIFVRVHQALAAAQPDASARLNSYFERLPPKQRALFEGVHLAGDGSVDVMLVLANVLAAGAWTGAAARARALEALEDLLAFALFEVKNCLPRPEADALLREVGRMQVGKA